jgi:hypothetical protein
MDRSPDRLNLDHLKKQAKDLIRLYRERDAAAMARFRAALPAAAGHSDDAISSLQLRLHDAQSCIAREHGFASFVFPYFCKPGVGFCQLLLEVGF